MSGIDKRPVEGPVKIARPVDGGSGVMGDSICDTRNHGGADQAVYAYAQEDLVAWSAELGRELAPGVFGENLTTVGIDTTNARIGEQWRIGADCVLQVTCPRVPCSSFAVWIGEQGWTKTFTERAVPGAYLRVVAPGKVSPGDPITIEYRPDHGETIATTFRALAGEIARRAGGA